MKPWNTRLINLTNVILKGKTNSFCIIFIISPITLMTYFCKNLANFVFINRAYLTSAQVSSKKYTILRTKIKSRLLIKLKFFIQSTKFILLHKILISFYTLACCWHGLNVTEICWSEEGRNSEWSEIMMKRAIWFQKNDAFKDLIFKLTFKF